MSRIYFHSPTKTIEVRGSERAHAACLISDLFWVALQYNDYESEHRPEPLRRLISPEFIRERGDLGRFRESLKLHLNALPSEKLFQVEGRTYGTFALQLNTAWVLGSNALRFLARLHGQCEIHAWVRGENRSWLAEIVKDGLASGLMRKAQGWEELVAFLPASASEPVVMSTSVCEQFPNYGIARQGDLELEDSDTFYDLSSEEKWKWAMKGLEAKAANQLELNPAHWKDYRFSHGKDAFWLRATADTLASQA